MTYRITSSINVHILPYLEDDEFVRGVNCFETLPAFKQDMLEQLAKIKHKVDKLTMKQITQGVEL